MKVLLAIDGSKQSAAAIEACAKFVKNLEQIKIMSVIELHYGIAAEPFAVSAEFYSEIQANERKNAEEFLQQAKTNLEVLAADSKFEILTEIHLGIPSQIIVEEAKDWKADLIIVGSHGYGFWQRAMLGSVSDAVIHHAPCSVLVVRDV